MRREYNLFEPADDLCCRVLFEDKGPEAFLMKILCKLGLHSYSKKLKDILILHEGRNNKGNKIIYYQCNCRRCGKNSIRIYPKNMIINFYNLWKMFDFFTFVWIKRHLYEPVIRTKHNEILENRFQLMFLNFEIEIIYKPRLWNPNSPIELTDIEYGDDVKCDEYLTREEYEKRFKRYLNK